MRIGNCCSGFALPSAIFILVILAALGAYAVKTSSSQHLALALDFQGARAYQAARVGVEWGIYKATKTTDTSCTVLAVTQWCDGTEKPLGTFDGSTVGAKCKCTGPYSDGAKTFLVFEITSTASQGSGASKVERQLSATVQSEPPP